jgi:hypothetical protein
VHSSNSQTVLRALVELRGSAADRAADRLMSEQCRKCHIHGHYAINCPLNDAQHVNISSSQQRRQRRFMSIQCRRCNQYGHFASDCPLNDTYEPPTLILLTRNHH